MKFIQKIVSWLSVAIFVISATPAFAQADADQLFIEGQNLQQKMTITAQNSAIKKFQAAKVIYVAQARKDMCDNQIAICNKNIQTIRAERKAKEQASQPQPVAQDTVQVDTHKDVSLQLSKAFVEFKASPKDGYTQSVKVTCNYDDWIIAEHPDWVTVYKTENKISIEVEDYSEGEEDRSGMIVIKCGDTTASLAVNQKSPGIAKQFLNFTKKLTKKKKNKGGND